MVAYRQYTKCEQPADWKPRSWWMISLPSLITAPIAAVLVFVAGMPWCLLIVAEISGLVWVIAYCRHFLYHRLVCLGGDRDVIGAIVSVSPPPAFADLDWDTDYSINLLLENTAYGVAQAQAEASQPYGYLVAPQDVITNPPVSRTTPGHTARDAFGTGLECATLHCEFEGAGVYDWMQISEGMLAFAIAALLACVLLPWPADVIVSAGLALLALLGWLIGTILSKSVQQGDPEDVDPNIGPLHTNDEPGPDGLGRGADIVYVQGTWVYDPLHDGWNEIHPIKVCTKCRRWDGSWGEPPPDIILRVRHGFDIARADGTLANQMRPEHQWELHPDVDGCAAVVIE